MTAWIDLMEPLSGRKGEGKSPRELAPKEEKWNSAHSSILKEPRGHERGGESGIM